MSNAAQAVLSGANCSILKQAEMRIPVAELIRRLGISEQALSLEEALRRLGDRTSSSAQAAGRGWQAEEVVAELTLDQAMLQEVLRKNAKALLTSRCGYVLVRRGTASAGGVPAQ